MEIEHNQTHTSMHIVFVHLRVSSVSTTAFGVWRKEIMRSI